VTDLSGYLKKTIWIFSIPFFVPLFFHSSVYAQSQLTTDAVFSHTIKETGTIETTATLTISSDQRTALTYYTVTIPQVDIDPEIYSISKKKSLEATIYDRSSSTDILIDLENSIIEADGSTKITISYSYKYEDSNIIDLVSKIADSPTSKVSITYPKDWGETSWISDQIESIKKSDTDYILTISQPDSTSVKLIFGNQIVYSFNISKSFNNPTESSNQYEVIIPQDTQFQKIIIDNITPQPTQALLDSNGNYILIFTLDPQTQKDIKFSGYVIMESHEYYSRDISIEYDNNDIYWSLDSNQKENIAEYLTDNNITEESNTETLIQYIYKYVIEKLKPSTSATTLAGGVRRGASEVLKYSTESTPEDYADVMRAFLSYYEIPTIYTIGYVSDISSYQDNGMFHYWLQVYDGSKWQILDPYLEDFSKVSLFGREQLDHISILNRLHDSISPTLTYYSDNDIKFEYVKDSTIQYLPASNTSISLEPYSILNKYIYGNINVENTGNTIFTSIELDQSQPSNFNNYIDKVTNASNSILLPHMNKDINFHLPFNELEDEMIFSTVYIKNGSKSINSEIVSTEYSISQRTGYEIFIKLISIFLFVITFTILYILINKFIYKK
jgi:hypothetical protein